MPTSRDLGAVARFAASQHGVVTRSQAAAFDLDRTAVARLVSRGFWEEAAPGVLVLTGSPATWHQRLMVATSVNGRAAIVSHGSAARLHVVEGFSADVCAVTMPRGRHYALPGVEVHRVGTPIPPGDMVTIGGIRCTGWARTLVDVAAHASAAQVERALDDFERRRGNLRWLEATARRLHRPGQRGTRQVLDEVQWRQERRGKVRGSWFQRLIKECLASPLIPGLEEEYEIRDAAGRFVARVDLAIPLVRLGLEGHSRAFHLGEEAEAIDERRDNRAAEAGWELKYLGYADASQTPRETRVWVERLVARRARDLGVELPRPAGRGSPRK